MKVLEEERVKLLLQEAAGVYKRVLDMSPEHVTALYNLALLEDSKLDEVESALVHYNRWQMCSRGWKRVADVFVRVEEGGGWVGEGG